LQSLGVHEHWNNSTDKQYSRNLGTGAGIELVRLQSSVTSVREREIASEFGVLANYPNPFNPTTTIRFSTSQSTQVLLRVYDIEGRIVATPMNQRLALGEHEVRFDGRGLASGVYFCRLSAGGSVKTIKLLLQK
jgi:hypothetical protein